MILAADEVGNIAGLTVGAAANTGSTTTTASTG